MARPHKPRCIRHRHDLKVFKPLGVPMTRLESVTLHMDELEALRLTNLLDLDQEQTARQMGVSRSTVSRILRSARKKITLAVVEGHALVMENGTAPLEQVDAPGAPPTKVDPK